MLYLSKHFHQKIRQHENCYSSDHTTSFNLYIFFLVYKVICILVIVLERLLISKVTFMLLIR